MWRYSQVRSRFDHLPGNFQNSGHTCRACRLSSGTMTPTTGGHRAALLDSVRSIHALADVLEATGDTQEFRETLDDIAAVLAKLREYA